MGSYFSLNWLFQRASKATCRTALSEQASLESAVKEVGDNLKGESTADLALVFASTDYASDLPRLLPLLKARLKARHWLGCAGGGVIGTRSDLITSEVERKPALSVTLLNLPGAVLHPFAINTNSLPDLDGPSHDWQQWVGSDPLTTNSMLLLVDPTTRSINDLISGLDYAYPSVPTIGGIAGPHNAAHGSLFFGDQVVDGAVGCTFGGEWFLESVVAQGCKPIGPVFAIERVQKNVLIELSHEESRDSPVAFLQRVLADLTERERDLVRHSLFLGVECKDLVIGGTGSPKAQAGFLVRNLIGVDPNNGAVAVAEQMRVGQNVQFQLREADASRQEAFQLLRAALDRTDQPPVFGLLMACLGRGESLYGVKNGDVAIARELIQEVPIAGAFCNGEIGSVGGATHVHGYTACWGLLRHISSIEDSSKNFH
ncbi:FIST N-terminal domain-containing protein [Prochlorococcus sp. MIT 1300]|uniref:FIST signal transduction protein n=1 Tax=Prochlorococcus sp. MIT 1300 TaxID=3096218 RepID=UPI002A76091F|nr:FIST N-terminal domain-containing protein [Prochlorococcus sp. MIT 1300]